MFWFISMFWWIMLLWQIQELINYVQFGVWWLVLGVASSIGLGKGSSTLSLSNFCCYFYDILGACTIFFRRIPIIVSIEIFLSCNYRYVLSWWCIGFSVVWIDGEKLLSIPKIQGSCFTRLAAIFLWYLLLLFYFLA